MNLLALHTSAACWADMITGIPDGADVIPKVTGASLEHRVAMMLSTLAGYVATWLAGVGSRAGSVFFN